MRLVNAAEIEKVPRSEWTFEDHYNNIKGSKPLLDYHHDIKIPDYLDNEVIKIMESMKTESPRYIYMALMEYGYYIYLNEFSEESDEIDSLKRSLIELPNCLLVHMIKNYIVEIDSPTKCGNKHLLTSDWFPSRASDIASTLSSDIDSIYRIFMYLAVGEVSDNWDKLKIRVKINKRIEEIIQILRRFVVL